METLYTIPEAAEKTRMSQAWWRMMIFQKKIKHLKIGRRVLIPESTIQDLFSAAIVKPRR
ncbi:MAG: helix-turn-helix domain-containing protein [Syntrophobacteraceae bacterium]|jgi:excisionase family DNA binding protein